MALEIGDVLFIDDSAALPSWTSDRWIDGLTEWSDAPGPRPPKRSKSGSAQRSETSLPSRTASITELCTYEFRILNGNFGNARCDHTSSRGS